jgi:acetyl-CoA carboxylase carboxyl transferase subunit beta
MKEFFRRTRKSFTIRHDQGEAQVPEDMWAKCPACRDIIYQKELNDNLKVCPKCSYHHQLRARDRLALLDPDTFEEYDTDIAPTDPLDFLSLDQSYRDRLDEVQQETGLYDAVISGTGRIAGQPLSLAICDFDFLGASMGSVYGEKMVRAAERAVEYHIPLLTINSSGGARMQEGVIALMQMAKVTMALTRLARQKLPHFSVMVDPCYGGVTASYASVADIIIAEPGARIGFAGKRVIEQTIRQKLPPDFQTAEFMLNHGMIDMVVSRGDLRLVIGRLLALHSNQPTQQDNQQDNQQDIQQQDQQTQGESALVVGQG